MRRDYASMPVWRLGLVAFARTFRFGGRATRSEILGFFLIAMVANLAVASVEQIAGVRSFAFGAVTYDYSSQALVIECLEQLSWLPVFALFARRLHDIGLPGPIGVPIPLAALVLSNWEHFDFIDPSFAPMPDWLGPVRMIAVILFYAACLWAPARGPNAYGPDLRLDPPSEPVPAPIAEA